MIGSRDARGWKDAERKSPLQVRKCIVCNRWFSKPKGQTCSKECAERAAENGD
jgi:hypothetical protein